MAVSAKKQSLVEVVYLKDRLGRLGRLIRRRGMTEFVSRYEANALIKAGTVEFSGTDENSSENIDESMSQESAKKLSRKEKKERLRKEKEERQRGKR